MFFHNLSFDINKTIILGVNDPIFLHYLMFFFSLFSEFLFRFVFGNVEFCLQNTAFSGPRVCSVYLNSYDFKG